MKQELKLMITEQKGIILRSDSKRDPRFQKERVFIRIVDEGKDIEFSTEKEAFIEEMKRFCKFDELKHLYE